MEIGWQEAPISPRVGRKNAAMPAGSCSQGDARMSRCLSLVAPTAESGSAAARIAAYDWQALAGELDSWGSAVLPKLLSPQECSDLAALIPRSGISAAMWSWPAMASAA